MAAQKRHNAPYEAVEYTEKEIRYIQALARGDAAPETQRAALDWIINSVCATYDLSYRPTSDRDTTFAEGRRFVGLQLVKMIKLNIASLNQPYKE